MSQRSIAMKWDKANTYGRDAGFVANVIIGHHRNPDAKLRGLLELLRGGHDVRTGQFAIDVLIVDWVRVDWKLLEMPNTCKAFAAYKSLSE